LTSPAHHAGRRRLVRNFRRAHGKTRPPLDLSGGPL